MQNRNDWKIRIQTRRITMKDMLKNIKDKKAKKRQERKNKK